MYKDFEIVDQLERQISDLRAQAHIKEEPFTSHLPLVGRLVVFIRKTWNNVAAKWYVRPMLHQQNLFNQAVVRAMHEVLRTQRDLDVYWRERFEELDQRIIANDHDTTMVARIHAESERRLQHLGKKTERDREVLIERLSRLEESLDAMCSGQQGEGK